jgi:hypothetical protein
MKQPKVITHLVVHHSASHPSTTVAEILKWHTERGFSTWGYHKIITDDGVIHSCRPESEVPASIKGFNKGTLAVCLTGSFSRDTPTQWQLISLQLQIQEWKTRFPSAKIIAHRDIAATECCGDNLYAWLKSKYP